MLINVVDVTTLVLVLRGYHKKFPFTTRIPKLGARWLSDSCMTRDRGVDGSNLTALCP